AAFRKASRASSPTDSKRRAAASRSANFSLPNCRTSRPISASPGAAPTLNVGTIEETRTQKSKQPRAAGRRCERDRLIRHRGEFGTSVDQLLEQPEVLAEVPVREEMLLNAPAGLLPQTRGLILVGQELPHEPAEGREVV